jgi:hypothetical protein
MLAQAAEADRAADAIFDAMDAAGTPDRFGFRPVIPAGFEANAERASDLRRRARCLRADAAEIVQDSAPRTAITPAKPPAAVAPAIAPPKPAEPVETADTVAARILNSNSVAPETRLVTSAPKASGAAETVDAIVARVLRA